MDKPHDQEGDTSCKLFDTNQIYIPSTSYVAVSNPPSSYVGPMGLGIGQGHWVPSNITLSPSNYAMPANPPTCFGQPGFVPRFDIPRSTRQADSCHVVHHAVLFNARSIKNKLPELHQLIYSSPLQFVFFTESWLNDDVTSSMLDPDGQFHVFRRDRHGRSGGGVCALISKSIKCFQIDQFLSNDNQCEFLCIDVEFNSATKYRFIVVYSSPHSCFKNRADLMSHTQSFLQLIENLSDKNFTIVIVGDFNLPRIDWKSFDCANDGVHDVVFNHLSELGFIQFVDQPTRLNNTATGNILDLIFSNDPMSINIETYGSPIGSSDHCIINFNVFTNSADHDSRLKSHYK